MGRSGSIQIYPGRITSPIEGDETKEIAVNSGQELTVRVEDDGKQRVLHVEGSLDLYNSAVLRETFVALLADSGAKGRDTSVDLGGLTAIDLSGLELLCSAHLSFTQRGDNLSLNEVPSCFEEAVAASGFGEGACARPQNFSCGCLWKAGRP